jgi:predicted ATP-binding protein involved in virulence
MADKHKSPIQDTHRFWLQSVEIKNYRCFRNIVIDLDENLTVLIARNGAGKTAVLDAVATALGTFVGSFHTGKGTPIINSDVRLLLTNPDLREMERQYPAAISAKALLDDESITWARHLNTPKSSTTIKEARPLTQIGERMQRLVTENKPVVLPLVAYYGTGRLWKQKKKTEKKVYESEFYSRTVGYQDCLDPASSFKLFEDWFHYAAQADSDLRNQHRERFGTLYVEADTPHTPLIAAVRQAVDECLQISGWRGLRYSFTHQAVVMEHPAHGVLEVSQLSDGVRNMIAMVADIAYRMVRLNGSDLGSEATRQTPGLILIDEVDMHLHPEWQQVVLQHLKSAFPKVQFIVTTHSPQVVSTVKREHVRELGENIECADVAAMPQAQTYGRSNADVMQSVMKVSPEPLIAESEILKLYLAQIEQGDWLSDEVTKIRRELNQSLGSDHPSLVRADMTIRRREALSR